MATTVSVSEAKARLSQLLVRVEAGEEIVIARGGRPIARLQRLDPAVLQRRPGSDGVIIRADFDDPVPEWDPDYMHPGDPMREHIG